MRPRIWKYRTSVKLRWPISSLHRLLPRMKTSSALWLAMLVVGASGPELMALSFSLGTLSLIGEPAFQLMTLDLTRRAARERIEWDEVDGFGLLEAGELFPASGAQLVFSHLFIAARDESDRHFAPPRIRLPHDGRVGDARILQQHALDLRRIDVLPAGLDEVFHA